VVLQGPDKLAITGILTASLNKWCVMSGLSTVVEEQGLKLCSCVYLKMYNHVHMGICMYATFEFRTVVLINIQIFWNMVQRRLICRYQHFRGVCLLPLLKQIYTMTVGTCKLLRNIGTNIPVYKSFQSVKGGIFIFAGSCNSE
jgi:hypothetical protein